MKIIIAEDDSLSRRKLEFTLINRGYEVISVSNGKQAIHVFDNESDPLLAIVDVLMPELNGLEVCRIIRQKRYVIPPYLILLTVKSEKEDIVQGLESGANDYIVKPFDREELYARVRVGEHMLELQQKLANRIKELEETLARAQHLQQLLRFDTNVYEFGPFRLEASERRLLRGHKVVPLTAKVFDMLLLLVQNDGHLVNKGELMTRLWPGSIVEENNLTVNMSILRKALGESPSRYEYIETVQKRGYRFIADVNTINNRADE